MTVTISAAAQTPAPSSFWLTAGVGGGYLSGGDFENAEGVALVGQLSYRTGAHLISARGSVVAEILGDGVTDFGVLYGRSADGGAVHLSASGGIGMAVFEDCPGGLGSGACVTDVTVGIPIALTGSWRPARFFGLGAQVLGNVNSARSFVAAAFVVEVGRLR